MKLSTLVKVKPSVLLFPLLLAYLSMQSTAQDNHHDHDDHEGHIHDSHGEHMDHDHSPHGHDHGPSEHIHDDDPEDYASHENDHGHGEPEEHSHDPNSQMDPSHDSMHEGHGNDKDHAHDHGANRVSFTDFTAYSEIFVEYADLIKDQGSECLIHVTELNGYLPVTSGSLIVRLVSDSDKIWEAKLRSPVREGIYVADIHPPFAGPIDLEFEFVVGNQTVIHSVDAFVYGNAHEIPLHSEEEESPNHISFLKEQQWKIDYSLSQANLSDISQTVPAIGSASIPHRGRFILPAPIDGLVFPTNDIEVEVGLSYAADQSVFTVKPSASWVDGISQLRQEYLTARIELEKLKKLHETNATSSERLKLSEIKVDTLQQSIKALGLDLNDLSSSELNVDVFATQPALLNEIFIYPGQQVNAGDPLASFLNDSTLIIEVKVPSSRIHQLGKVSDAMIQPAGSDNIYSISALGGKLISSRVQRSSERGISVVRFSIPNEDGLFFDGMQFQVYLMDATKTNEVVTVPKSAILEESGIPMIYVQIEGETIEKRLVKIGKSDGKHVGILSGVSAGEYVVATGGAYVRLASLATTEMGHGHSH